MAKRKKKTRAEELLDELIKEYGGSEGVTGPDGLLKDLTRAVVNRAMDAEMTHHLGYEARGTVPEGQPNRRNGKNGKTVRTNQGPVEIEVPRDRDGSVDPKIVPTHKRHFDGFDDKILPGLATSCSPTTFSSDRPVEVGVLLTPGVDKDRSAGELEECGVALPHVDEVGVH